MSKYKSKESAVENVKRFFSNHPEDKISLHDAFRAWGRPNAEDLEANKPWLSNILGDLKYHDLVMPIYSYSDGRKKLNGLQLTFEGKKALKRIAGDNIESKEISQKEHKGDSISLEDVMTVIPRLRKEHPQFEIVFNVTLKNDSANMGGSEGSA